MAKKPEKKIEKKAFNLDAFLKSENIVTETRDKELS